MVDTSQPKQHVRDFWPKARRRGIVLTIIMELLVAGILTLALFFSGINVDNIAFAIIIIAGIASSIGINLILAHMLMTPLKDLSAALTHVSGEPSDIIPPNSSAPSRKYDGLEPLIELIYKLSSQDTSSATPVAATEPTTDIVSRALAQTDAGVIICDEAGKVLYASAHAPIGEAADGSPELTMLFESPDTFENWLATARDQQVKSSHTWQRVADKIVGDPDRRIFDVFANYEKGSTAPVVLITVDRSSTYQPEDDQLDFISFAAHELRGPVTVIRGYLDVFREEVESPSMDADERATLLSRLVVSANRLSGYITNILNASRHDRQHLKINLREYTLPQVYAAIADDMSLRASTQNRLLSVQIPSDLPTIAADPSSLTEVLSNLIDNAIKYSNEGGTITVNASVDGEFVRVNVIDQGIGIPANVVSNLFHKFYRSHRSRETVAGTGIGLYISKAIVDGHGGIIEVKSEENKGSTFSFTVPIYATVAEKLTAAAGANDAIIRQGESGWIKNHAKYRG